jgi:hypothetical protein
LFLNGHLRTETVLRANYSFGNFNASVMYAIGYFAFLILICGILFRIGAMMRIKN